MWRALKQIREYCANLSVIRDEKMKLVEGLKKGLIGRNGSVTDGGWCETKSPRACFVMLILSLFLSRSYLGSKKEKLQYKLCVRQSSEFFILVIVENAKKYSHTNCIFVSATDNRQTQWFVNFLVHWLLFQMTLFAGFLETRECGCFEMVQIVAKEISIIQLLFQRIKKVWEYTHAHFWTSCIKRSILQRFWTAGQQL